MGTFKTYPITYERHFRKEFPTEGVADIRD